MTISELETQLENVKETRQRICDSLYTSKRLGQRNALIERQRSELSKLYAVDAGEKEIQQAEARFLKELQEFDRNEAKKGGEMLKLDKQIAALQEQIFTLRQKAVSPDLQKEYEKQQKKLAELQEREDQAYTAMRQAEIKSEKVRAPGPAAMGLTITEHDRLMEPLLKEVSKKTTARDEIRQLRVKQEAIVAELRVTIEARMASAI